MNAKCRWSWVCFVVQTFNETSFFRHAQIGAKIDKKASAQTQDAKTKPAPKRQQKTRKGDEKEKLNFGKRFVLDSPRRNSRLRPRPGVLCSPSSPALQQRGKAEQPHMISLHFLRGFDMKKEQAARSTPFSSRIQRKMRQEISAAGFPCWWAGRGGRESTIGTSRPASASPSSSALQLHFTKPSFNGFFSLKIHLRIDQSNRS